MKKNNDSLGSRMKRYEVVSKGLLPLNSYVIVRVDGKKFSTYTKNFVKPFDQSITDCMNDATIALCKEMQNAVCGYVQSDEISILMYDGTKVESQPYFDNEIQKICSITASTATATFNQQMNLCKIKKAMEFIGNDPYFISNLIINCVKEKQAKFDSRCFVLPNVDEVVNYFLWRYKDCVKNSISSVAQAHFSQKQLDGKNSNQRQEMLFTEKGINWNDLDGELKRGRLCVKTENGWEIGACPHIVCNPDNEFYQLINTWKL